MLTLCFGFWLTGCAWFSDKDDSFSALGEANVDLSQYQQGGTNSGNNGDDTGFAGDSGLNSDAPFITDLSIFFNSYQGIGDVIEVHIMYEDQQDDLLNGVAIVSYSGGGGEIPIDNESAMLEEGEITILFDGVDTASDYSFTVALRDASGNESETVESELSAIQEESEEEAFKPNPQTVGNDPSYLTVWSFFDG